MRVRVRERIIRFQFGTMGGEFRVRKERMKRERSGLILALLAAGSRKLVQHDLRLNIFGFWTVAFFTIFCHFIQK